MLGSEVNFTVCRAWAGLWSAKWPVKSEAEKAIVVPVATTLLKAVSVGTSATTLRVAVAS